MQLFFILREDFLSYFKLKYLFKNKNAFSQFVKRIVQLKMNICWYVFI